MTNTPKKPAKKQPTKDKKGKPFVWNKGTNKETIKLGNIEITLRGLTYREQLHIAPMETADADTLTIRMGIVDIKGLFLDEEVEEEYKDKDDKVQTRTITKSVEQVFETEDYFYNDRTIKIMTEQFCEDFFEPRLIIISQALDIIVELTGTTVKEAEAVKFFRSKK